MKLTNVSLIGDDNITYSLDFIKADLHDLYKIKLSTNHPKKPPIEILVSDKEYDHMILNRRLIPYVYNGAYAKYLNKHFIINEIQLKAYNCDLSTDKDIKINLLSDNICDEIANGTYTGFVIDPNSSCVFRYFSIDDDICKFPMDFIRIESEVWNDYIFYSIYVVASYFDMDRFICSFEPELSVKFIYKYWDHISKALLNDAGYIERKRADNVLVLRSIPKEDLDKIRNCIDVYNDINIDI